MVTTVVVSSGQTLSGYTVTPGTELIVQNGGTIIDVTDRSAAGGYGIVLNAGAVASGTNVAGNALFTDDGTATDTVVEQGGFEEVDSVQNGGTVFGVTTVNYEGARISGVTIGATGRVIIELNTATGLNVFGLLSGLGGAFNDTTIAKGGTATLQSTSVFNALVRAGGTLEINNNIQMPSVDLIDVDSGGYAVLSGGRAEGVTISSGGLLVLTASAMVSSGHVQSGGMLLVEPGTSARGFALAAGADVISTGVVLVEAGGSFTVGQTLDGTVLSAGGTEFVLLSGLSTNAQIAAGTSLTVFSGGTVSGGSDAGLLTVSSGGAAHDLIVAAGGTATVLGHAYDTSVEVGGVEAVGGGGIETGGTVAGLLQESFEEGTIDQVTITATGTVETTNGGSMTTVFGVLSGGAGTLTDTTVAGGGLFYLGGVGVAAGVQVLSGAVFSANDYSFVSGVTASDINVDSGGYALVNGSTIDGMTISAGGLVDLSGNGTVSGGSVQSGGILVVEPGASTAGFTLDAGARVVSTGVVLVDHGVFTVQETIVGRVLTSGGTELVLSGGRAQNTTVRAGAFATVLSGGVVFGGNLSGELYVEAGAAARFLTVQGLLTNYGTADGNTVASGGVLQAFGRTVDTTIDQGGTVEADQNSKLKFTTVGSGGLLQVDAQAAHKAVSTTIQAGGRVEFSSLPNHGTPTASVGPDNLLSVTQGGDTETLKLAGDYTGEQFVASQVRGYGGVIVTVVPNTPSAAAILRGELGSAGGAALAHDLHAVPAAVPATPTRPAALSDAGRSFTPPPHDLLFIPHQP